MRADARFIAVAPVAICVAAVLLGASPSPLPDPAVSPSAAPAVAIIDVVFSPIPVRPGKPVSVTVHTTPNAVSIEGHVMAHDFTVPKTGDGVFYGAGKVPWWGRFFHGSINVTFVATDESGAQAQMEQTVRM